VMRLKDLEVIKHGDDYEFTGYPNLGMRDEE
jgi:hypothetical protein